MRAYIVERPDGEFRAVDLPRPIPAAGQVLVRVLASGVNPLDTKIRSGKAAHAQQPLPAVLGLDMAGVIEEPGPGVTAFRNGDAVYGMIGGVGGLQGTLAEFVIADSQLLARKPESLSMRETAALPLVTITAWEGIVDRAACACRAEGAGARRSRRRRVHRRTAGKGIGSRSVCHGVRRQAALHRSTRRHTD